MRPSKRISEVQSAIIQDVKALPRRPDTISLGQGVPFFSPPAEVLSTLKEKLHMPESHRYSPDAGLLHLREEIARKLSRENCIDASPERGIIVTAGGNQAFFSILLTITDPGDEVILLRPYYFNHEMAIRMLSCNPVIVDCDSEYKPGLGALKNAITPKTRAIITISPNNPTGAVYSEKLLREINGLCAQDKIYHISDEAYEHFTYDGAKHYSPGAGSGAGAHTISIFSLSKSYGMAGWRIGYMTVPEELFDDVIKAQDTTIICPNTLLQEAAIEAIRLGASYPEQFTPDIKRNRGIFLKHLGTIEPGVTTPATNGGYYFLSRIDTKKSAIECTRHLLREHGVEVIPGDAFGCRNGAYLRLSYGNVTEDDAKEGMRRFSAGIREILGQ